MTGFLCHWWSVVRFSSLTFYEESCPRRLVDYWLFDFYFVIYISFYCCCFDFGVYCDVYWLRLVDLLSFAVYYDGPFIPLHPFVLGHATTKYRILIRGRPIKFKSFTLAGCPNLLASICLILISRKMSRT